MDIINCNANQQFGLPLNPFPLGSSWTSVREMLYDVMVDFHREWVQDFFLRPDPLEDMRALLSQQRLEKSAAFTMHFDFDENLVPDFGTSSAFLVGVLLPIDTIDDITTGLTVSSFATRNSCIDKTDFVSRAIINSRHKSSVNMVWNNESGTIGLNYCVFYLGKRPLQLVLKFDKLGFLSAFESMPGRINFPLLEKSLVSSTISDIIQANKISSKVQQNSLTASRGENFPHRDMFAMGDWAGTSVVANYKDSVLQKTSHGFTL
eukprot:IDg9795t1